MKKLSENFKLEKYGISVRLCRESDAAFILSIRTDAHHTRFIHQTENNLNKQIEWIKKYKERESEGREYYFIYTKDDIPFGMSRVYNIFEYYGTSGSWLCQPNNDPKDSLATYLLMHDVMFGDMGLDLLVFDVRKDNKKVWRMHESFGALRIGESDIDFYFSMFKNTYFQKRERYIEFFL